MNPRVFYAMLLKEIRYKTQMGNRGSNTTNTDDAATEEIRIGTSMSTDPVRPILTEHALNSMAHKDKDQWLKDMRGNLSLVATVISTMTFQVAINPPGGVRPATDTGDDIVCGEGKTCPGESVLAVVYPDAYERFLLSNTICFVASLSVCLLLVSGIPLHHRFPMWLLSIGMCVTLSSLAFTYLLSVQMVTPGSGTTWESVTDSHLIVLIVWGGLLLFVGLFLTIRFVIWVVKLFIRAVLNILGAVLNILGALF